MKVSVILNIFSGLTTKTLKSRLHHYEISRRIRQQYWGTGDLRRHVATQTPAIITRQVNEHILQVIAVNIVEMIFHISCI